MKSLKIANLILLVALTSNCTRKAEVEVGKPGADAHASLPTQGGSDQSQAVPSHAIPVQKVEGPQNPPANLPLSAGTPQVPTSPESQTPTPPASPACLTFAFQHLASPKHTPGPDCAHHKNRVNLPQAFLDGNHDLKQLCVRVDGVPVVFVREGNTLTLSGAPRSRSIISVRACRKGLTCGESCNIPQDELMNDLAGESSDAATGWDEDSAVKVAGAIDDEIKRELASLDDEEISKDWAVNEQPAELPALACASRAAKKSVASKSRE